LIFDHLRILHLGLLRNKPELKTVYLPFVKIYLPVM
jgi:hypothetical protein